MVAVAVDQGAAGKVAEFRKESKATFPIGTDSAMLLFDYMQIPVMVRPQMPYLAFLDRDGNVQAQFGGESPFFQKTGANARVEVGKLLGAGKAHPAAKKAAKKR
jgi:hypothetical protein